MQVQIEVTKTINCSHHWIIDTCDGPVSSGRCRLCGEVKEFYNTCKTDLVNRIIPPEETPAETSY